jgi:hypothetical protein
MILTLTWMMPVMETVMPEIELTASPGSAD